MILVFYNLQIHNTLNPQSNPALLYRHRFFGEISKPQLSKSLPTKNCANKLNVSNLNCLLLNPTSLNNKSDELDALIAVHAPQIMFFTETWFDNSSAPHKHNYDLYRSDRPTRGGGVAIYISSALKSTESHFDILNSKLCEQIWSIVEYNSLKFLLGCIYRPPVQDFNAITAITNSLNFASSLVRNKTVNGLLIAGDFNFPNIVWKDSSVSKTPSSSSLNELAHIFTSSIESNLLYQAIDRPTFQLDLGALTNTLDLVITDSPERVSNFQFFEPICRIKGHLTITWEFNLPNYPKLPHASFKPTYNFKKGNYVKIVNEINNFDWLSCFNKLNINQFYDVFAREFSSWCSKFIPLKKTSTIISKNNNLWIDSTLRKSIRHQHRLWYQNIASSWGVRTLVDEFTKLRSSNKKSLRSSKKDYEKMLANKSKTDPKLIYAYVRSKSNIKGQIRALKDLNGVCHTDAFSLATLLNKQFSSVFSAVDNQPLPTFDTRTNEICDETPVLRLITCEHITQLIHKLDSNKSAGIDGINPFFLKKCLPNIALPIMLIFKRSILDESLPDCWKLANVTPIHKKGSKYLCENYRPISLTSILCKLLEKIIKTALFGHLYQHRLLCKNQHGFVSRKACSTNLLETSDMLTYSLAKGLGVDLILLDFAKAFDKVSHEFLIHKLRCYGISGKLLSWIKNFLFLRKQRVILGEGESDWSEVLSGVPQGSVLGPLLFIIYINDMPDKIKSNVLLYADDSKLISTIRDSRDNLSLQADIDHLINWSVTWKMSLNFEKCKTMHFGPSNPKFVYTMADRSGVVHSLEQTSCERDLGIKISDNGKWQDQCSAAASKANQMLTMLARSFSCRHQEIWIKLYMSLVRPHLDFAAPVWSPNSLADSQMVEKIQ